ncbi:MAG: S9 family peptidase [Saprospiraceae bacterium]|nr:S9 family peptidase [Saprospiraceae bacterium]MBP6567135.1 S9 family peptidase [Saprospiraceae bacterium]
MPAITFTKKWIFLFMIFNYYYGAAQSDFPYQKPDTDILSLADARPAPSIRIKADASLAVLLFRNAYKSIEEMAAPEMKLAGIRINPMTNSPSRITYFNDIKILDILSGTEYSIDGMPVSPALSNFVWSNDQSLMAFTNTVKEGMELWILDVNQKKVKKLTEPILNANVGNVFIWSKDNKSLLLTTLVKDRKPLLDGKFAIPTGPVITENDGQKAQNRTYQDLLKNPVDEQNFELLTTSEISRVNLDGKLSLFKGPAMYVGMSFSPDGSYLLTYELKKPFSYIVTYDRFPTDINLLDKDGKFIKTFISIPLTEELPKGFMAVRKGPRSLQWRADKPSSLYWAEALDGGDPAIEVTERDAIYTLDAPFETKPVLLVKTKERYAGIQWGDDNTAILNERWWNTRNSRILVFNPSLPGSVPRLFNERNEQDNYADPGNFVTKRNKYQLNTLDLTDNQLYMIGDGFSKEGKFPFIDKYSITDFKKTRIYQSKEKDKLEQLISAVDVLKGIYLTRLESKNEYPDFYLRNVKNNTLKQISHNVNPFQVLNGVHKEVIKYSRPDGVELSATLYLPAGYDKSKLEKMPMIMWAYPTEFKDKASAGQVTANANEFTFPYYGSPLYWLTKGYVVLDDASFPIIGEGKNEPNDTFIPQLVSNAKAAIDAVDKLGYIDRTKVAVGGHSYGAFMTANLLTHSDLFAAGIARSGAYNRSLTPFGFQSEERNYWEAPEVYDAMSPFQHADKMKSPLLLIHGEEDNNSGTHTMQSERYFNALKGLGATARLVILPKESHGYAARESILHMLWEQDQWLDKYVKNRKPDAKP